MFKNKKPERQDPEKAVKKKYLKANAGFLLCVFIAMGLTFLISGTGGWLVLTVMLTAFVVSLIIFAVSRKNLQFFLDTPFEILNKNDDFKVRLTCSKKNFIPSCFVEVEINSGDRASGGKTFKFVLSKLNDEIIEIPLKAVSCGKDEIKIESIRLIDYLGLITAKLDLNQFEDMSCFVKILPEIHDTGEQQEILKTTTENMTFEDSDEESDETAVGSTGVPGYEHREYQIGDPLKRVNWKMSSKKDKLMIRLDEKVSASSQSFILDLPKPVIEENEDSSALLYSYAELAGHIVEASLSMLYMLVRRGFETDYNFYLDGYWQTVTVKDEQSLLYLQEELAGIEYYDEEVRFPKEANNKNLSQMIFSSCSANMNKTLVSLVDNSVGSGVVVAKESGISKFTEDMWTVDHDFTFEKL